MAIQVQTLTCEVYDKTFIRRGFVSDFLGYDVHFRWGEQGGGTFTVDNNHYYLNALTADGARVVLRYGSQMMSGILSTRAGDSGPPGTLTLTVEDDWRLGRRILGWPNPLGAISAQGLETAYDRKTGPAETVLKWYLSRNGLTRLGLPLVMATDQGRGATITAQLRMHVIWDQLLPLLIGAGIGPTIRQSGTSLRVDVYASQTFGHLISADSGVVEQFTWQQTGPTVTRVVVGGEGEGKNRDFRSYIDTNREAQWGDIQETFIDARDAYSDVRSALDDQASKYADFLEKRRDMDRALDVYDYRVGAQKRAKHVSSLAADYAADHPTNQAAQDRKTEAASDLTEANTALTTATSDRTTAIADYNAANNAWQASTFTVGVERGQYTTDLNNRAAEALSEGAATTTLSMTLTDNNLMRFGETVYVGDQFNVQLIPGAPTVLATIIEANAVLADDGPSLRLIVGEKSEDPTRGLWNAVATLARAVRRDRAGR